MLHRDQYQRIQAALPCRGAQLELLDAFLSKDATCNPRGVLVHGTASTGKTALVRRFLEESGARFSWVDCDQCVTIRIMLQRALRAIKRDTHDLLGITPLPAPAPAPGASVFDVVTENFTAFYSALDEFQQATGTTDSPHFLVLDRLDQMPDNPVDIVTCLARLPEISTVRNLVPIFIISTLEPRAFITTHIPHIRFPSYTNDETFKILTETETSRALCKLPASVLSKDNADQQQTRFWNHYCQILISTLSSYAGSDLRLIKETAQRLWPTYIDPVVKGTLEITNLVALYRHNEQLFTSETAVLDKLIAVDPSAAPSKAEALANELPLQSKYIICAAYLASYNPERFDIRFFSRAKDVRAKRRDTGRRKALKVNPRLLAAPAFDLERMLAILHAIAPTTSSEIFTDDPDKAFPSNIDVGVQIATLTTLKLIVRTSSTDPLDSRTRWKINASWVLVKKLADDIGLDIHAFLMEE